MPTDRTISPSGALPQAAVRNNANVFGWTALAAGALVALSLCVFFGNEMLGAKEPVSVTLRDSTAATTAAAFVGAADEKPAAGTGTFKGVVTFKGKPPARKVIVPKGGVGNPDVKPEDRAICAADDLLSDELIVNEKADNAVANVVIYLKKSPEGYTAPPVPKEPAVLDQKGCRFTPHILVLRCNQKLIVKNGDGLPHNTHFTPVRNQGENKAIGANDREGFDFVYKKPVKCLPVPGRVQPVLSQVDESPSVAARTPVRGGHR